MAKLFANSGDLDQMPHSVTSDLGMHCLPITFLGVSRLQWVNKSCVHDMRDEKVQTIFTISQGL